MSDYDRPETVFGTQLLTFPDQFRVKRLDGRQFCKVRSPPNLPSRLHIVIAFKTDGRHGSEDASVPLIFGS